MKPHRVQLYRKKGWRMPPNTVKVSRPSKWGNPFPINKQTSVFDAVDLFRRRIEQMRYDDPKWFRDWIKPLKGKNLACWCKASPCHADVLLELANAELTTFSTQMRPT